MIYIQRKDKWQLETVDEFETMKEAREMLKEYRLSDPSAYYYTSSRACKGWIEDKENPMIIQSNEINVSRMLMEH